MIRRPPRSTRTDTLFPYTTLFRSALDTLALIERGGPYPHRQDGGTFQNRERLLPAQPRGYYREYTVRTPGSRDRGARRIVSGGSPPAEFFYTDDHYRRFRPFAPAGSARCARSNCARCWPTPARTAAISLTSSIPEGRPSTPPAPATR